jgi:hypothetical protein
VRVINRRTTTLVAVLAAAAAFAVPGGATTRGAVPQLIFPVVGPVTYRDDFGEPRAKWPHPGNDLMASKRQIAVAAEPGTITFWTHSATAGCMLYLHGKSGTTYQYIHLNNDLTAGNDNRGKCVAGTAYPPGLKDGSTVQAGQPVGFVGDSGDANGIHPHLHFEVHPNDGAAVDPYPYLRKAVHLLFPVDPATSVSMSMQGTVARAAGGRLALTITKLTVFPIGLKLTKLGRPLVVSVPDTVQVDTGDGLLVQPDQSVIESLAGKNVVVLTAPTPATLDVALAKPGALSASRIALAH